MKRTIWIILIALILIPSIAHGDSGFTLGDEITPAPVTGDCDDSALYSYYYLSNAGYEPVIYYGRDPHNLQYYHIWLLVEGYVYDGRMVYQDDGLYKGR